MEQQNEKGQGESNDKSLASISVFDVRAHLAFIHKKTEKLVAAIYVVSNFIKDNEPLKWSIREKAIELLELASLMNFVSFSERRELIREHEMVSKEIISLAGIGFHSELISEMNYDVLKREFELLSKTIEESEKKNEGAIFAPDFFETKNLLERSNSDVRYKNPGVNEMSFKKQKDKKQINVPKKPIIGENYTKDTRRIAIVKLLEKKGGLGVKDFTQAIQGVSEKTIQRELLFLVSQGTLRKEGQKRWSKYFLAV